MTITLSSQYHSSGSYGNELTLNTQSRLDQTKIEQNSGGNTTRDIGSNNPKRFEDSQLQIDRNKAFQKNNASMGLFAKEMASTVAIFQEMASDFSTKLTEVRNSSPYVDPSFKDSISSNILFIGTKINKSTNGFCPFGFDSGNMSVVDINAIQTALPSGATQDFSYLNSNINGNLTFRASDDRSVTLRGIDFHTVMEKFFRAQRIALSADMNGDRVSDPSLSSAATLMQSVLDDLKQLQASFGHAAALFEEETESLKGEAVNLGTIAQATGYRTPVELMQISSQEATALKAQQTSYLMELERVSRWIEKLERT